MLIGIDGNEANVGERVGVNVWAFEVLRQFERKKGEGRRKKENIKFQIYLSRQPMKDLPVEAENWKYRVIGPGRFWTRWRLPLDLYLHRPRPDVFLSLSHYSPKWAPMPRVVSIMDLSFLKFPEAFKPTVRWQLKNWTRESVKNAAHIITISEFNKKEIVKYYGYQEEKITVIYPGVSEVFKGRTPPRRGPTLGDLGDKKYLLFVGTRQPKKNLERLIQAFGMVRKRFPRVELVIAGKVWGQFSEATDMEYLKVRPCRGKVGPYQIPAGVKFLGYVPDQDLPGLMAGAAALVLPSLYEGFGIPAAEAMTVGTPVVASNVTGLPEVIGDAEILFDPLDVDDMAEKICRVLTLNAPERQELVKKGMIRAKKFDWETAAENILRILLAVRQGVSLEGVSLNER
jgi:glycosyltransferase involved in cell wall biosynthesis